MRKNNNKALKLVIILILFLTIVGFSSPVSAFSDVRQNDWFYQNVTDLQSRGIVNGYPGNVFRPANNVTHGESLKMLVMLGELEIPITENLPIRMLNTYKQGSHWSEPYAQSALDNNILKLEPNGLDYNRNATRFETVNYILRYINSATDSSVARFEMTKGYHKDSKFIDAYGDGMDFLYGANIIMGNPTPNGYVFAGDRNVSRAEFTAMMDRAERFVTAYKNGDEIQEPVREPIVSSPVQPPAVKLNIPGALKYSISDYSKNTTETDDLIMALYYMQYNDMEEITIKMDSTHTSKVLTDGQMSSWFIENVRAAYRYLSLSYPELFFNENRIALKGAKTGSTVEITIGFTSPIYEKKEAIRRRNHFEAETIKIAETLISTGRIKPGMSQRDMAMVINEWVKNQITYDYDSDVTFNNDGYDALVDGISVCHGYTATYNRLLRMFGIEVIGVGGHANDGEYHVWTEATLDGQKHYIDTTWNDVEGMNNKYFTTDRSVFSNTRTWDEAFFNQYRGLIK